MKALIPVLILLALPALGQAKRPSTMAEALAQLQRASTPAAALPALDYIVRNAAAAPSLQLFMGATAAVGNGRLEDGAFLFYAAQMRSRYDLVLFPPRATGAESPTALLAALNQQVGAVVNPAIMREPKSFAAVVRRVEAWTPAVPPGYQPGWAHTAGKADAAKSLFATQRAAFSRRFGALSTLLNDPEYFAAFRTVQDYNFSGEEQQRIAARKKAKEAAEAKMLEIERKRGIEGLYYSK